MYLSKKYFKKTKRLQKRRKMVTRHVANILLTLHFN